MLEMIMQGIRKFDGFIKLCPEKIEDRTEEDQFYRMKLLAFSLDNTDEITDLISICLPHEEINQRLILSPLANLMNNISGGKIDNAGILKHLGGIRILNYDKIEQLRIKSLELSDSTVASIEISKLVIKIVKTFLKSLDTYLHEVINLTPLMVIED